MVGGQLEHRGQLAARDDLASVGEIDDRGDVPERIPTHGEVMVGHRRVGQHDTVVDGQRHEWGDTERRNGEAHRRRAVGELLPLEPVVDVGVVDDDDLVDSRVGRVRDDDAGAEFAEQIRDADIQFCPHVGEDRLGILVHPRDRRARQDVVELLGEHLLPQMIDLGRAAEGGRPEFGFDQQAFAAPVAELRLQLARQRASMRLEVQLTTPHRRRCASLDIRSIRSNIAAGVPTSSVARASMCASRRARSSISRVGPPPPSPWPNGISESVLHAWSLEVGDRERELGRCDLGVVGVDRREVGEHLRSVEALPPERAVRELVLLVPAQLLGDEPVHAAGGEHLRQTGRDSRTRRGSTPRCSERRTSPRSSAARTRSGGPGSRPTAGSCRPRPTSRRPESTGPARRARRSSRTARDDVPRSTRSAGRTSSRTCTPGSRP